MCTPIVTGLSNVPRTAHDDISTAQWPKSKTFIVHVLMFNWMMLFFHLAIKTSNIKYLGWICFTNQLAPQLPEIKWMYRAFFKHFFFFTICIPQRWLNSYTVCEWFCYTNANCILMLHSRIHFLYFSYFQKLTKVKIKIWNHDIWLSSKVYQKTTELLMLPFSFCTFVWEVKQAFAKRNMT